MVAGAAASRSSPQIRPDGYLGFRATSLTAPALRLSVPDIRAGLLTTCVVDEGAAA